MSVEEMGLLDCIALYYTRIHYNKKYYTSCLILSKVSFIFGLEKVSTNGRAAPGTDGCGRDGPAGLRRLLVLALGQRVAPGPISYGNSYYLYTWFNEVYYTERSLLVILKQTCSNFD